VSENQKTLLQQALDMLEEQALHIEAPMLPAGEELLKRIRAAISQQVEPAPAQCPADLLLGDKVLRWNRLQMTPPIAIGQEYWVAESVIKLARGES